MTDRAVDEFFEARHKMAGDFRTMINDSEDLLKAAGSVSNEAFATARKTFEGKLKEAKLSLADASQSGILSTRRAAALADTYVHENPWTAVGVAIAAGSLLGFLAAKR